jgi:phage repressor protein C with HTH and peptisase S24 domain
MFDIKRFCEDKGLNQTEFGKIIDVEQSVVSHMVRGLRKFRLEHIEKLREKYGDIVDNYRTDGRVTPQPPAATMSPAPEQADTLRDIQGDYSAEHSVAAVVVEPIPLVPDAVLRNPDKDIIEWMETSEAQKGAHFFDIFDILRRAKFAIKTDDDSMAPALFQNEYVLMRPIDRSTRIVNGKPYGIETTTAEAMIRILYDKGDSILAVALNKQYGDMEIPKSEVVRLHQPIFHGSTRLSIVPDQSSEVLAKDGQIAQQGAQINSLIADLGKSLDELSKSGARQDKLIEMLDKREK